VAPDGGRNAFSPQLGADVVDQAGRAAQAADTMDHPNSVIERTGIWSGPRVGRRAIFGFVAARMVLLRGVGAMGSLAGHRVHQIIATSLR
jgi:hypothetical protein